MPATPLPPIPRGHWLLGHLPEFRQDMLAFLSRCARDHGDCVRFRLGLKSLVLVSHPDLVEQVLATSQRHFSKRTYLFGLLVPVLGQGLLTSEGDHWLGQRRLIQPAFRRERVASSAVVMVDHAERAASGWREGETRDVHADLMQLTLGIVLETLFDAGAVGASSEVSEALEVLMDHFSARLESLWPLPSGLPTPGNLRLRRAVRRLDALVFGLIRQRRGGGAAGADLLAHLLQVRDEAGGSGMDDRQLRDELVTLILAGHETTANALTWACYLLAQHPEAEARLVRELSEVLGGRPPGAADLPRLTWTGHVVTEAMRLYPPAYLLSRLAVRESTLGGYRIPAGTTVMVSQWVQHRDARYFDNPEKFRPERWADGLAQRLPKFAYFPFGGGPRVCIGNTFATLEAVLVLAALAQRVRWTLAPGHPVTPRPSITLRPEHGLRMVVNRRGNRA